MDNDAHNLPLPVCRAAITAERITFNLWNPALMPVVPGAEPLRSGAERGVFLADIYLLNGEARDGREIAVTPLDPEAPVPVFVHELLRTWAAAVGHTRVWLPDGVLEVATDSVPVGAARVTCPTCGSRWSDAEESFFAMVREHGFFPPACWVCGGSLPEWTLDGAQQLLFGAESAE
jgi:hypothetical protein